MLSERHLVGSVCQHASHLAQAVAAAEYWHKQVLERARQEYETRLEEIKAQYSQALAEARERYEAAMAETSERYEAVVTKAKRELAELEEAGGFLTASWDSPLWEGYAPCYPRDVPRFARIGRLEARGQYDSLQMPALIPLIGHGHLILKADGAAKDEAVKALQALMFRLLATFPPGKLKFILIDPVGLGANVAGFLNLPEEVIGEKAWNEPEEIERRLRDLTIHMETVIQKYLRNRFETMEDYNAQAGEVAEPYRFLVIANFPVNFTDTAARRLLSIAANGPRTGVYILMTWDAEAKLPYSFNPADLMRLATVIACDGGRFVWQDEDFRDCRLTLDSPPPTSLFDRVVGLVGPAAVEASKVEVPFEKVAPPPEAWWQADSRYGLKAPIGVMGADQVQYLDLGKGTAQHALVAGKTGSGKSNLMHVIITSLALTFSPEELELYLVDFKKGVEFKDYATFRLPHARVIAIESEREFGLSVLRKLNAELQRRGDIFRAAGCTTLREYEEKTGNSMPRVFLLVDEFQEFFAEDDRLAQEVSLILDRLVRQGRAFGMHVLMGSQSLAGVYTIARSTADQMAVRIALQCSDADSRLILSEDNDAARLLARPGEAIYNAMNGLPEGNIFFQIAWLPDEVREAYLERIRELAEERGYVPPEPQIVFEGNVPARVEGNRELRELLEAPRWPTPSRRVYAWLGEPVEIKPHTAAIFRRQSRSNLLIVGQNEGAGVAMMLTALVSLAAQHRPEAARFYIVDLSTAGEPWDGLTRVLAQSLPHDVKWVRRRRDVVAAVREVADLVAERLEREEEPERTVYLALIGLQRARDLRSEDFFEPSEGARALAAVLRDGPDVGVHTLIWCDTYANLERVLERRQIGEFDLRVAMPMSVEASNNLLDSSAASKLKPHYALFYDEERVGYLEKFRPYALPDEGWLTEVGKMLSERMLSTDSCQRSRGTDSCQRIRGTE